MMLSRACTFIAMSSCGMVLSSAPCKVLMMCSQYNAEWQLAKMYGWCMHTYCSDSTQELTLDDNRHNTAWYYRLERGTSCTYINSQDGAYYKCHLIGLQRPRDGSKEFRWA